MKKRPILGQEKKKKVKRVYEYKRDAKEVAFYKTYKWRKTSESYRKAFPLCCQCSDKGRTKKANVVDHITPIKEGGALYDWDNLQSLCHSHHNKKTAEDERNKRNIL